MAIANPFSDDDKESNQWNVLSLGKLGGFDSLPGVAKLNIKTTYIWDAPKSKDQNSAILTYQGMAPRNVDVMLWMWTDEHVAQWEKVYADIMQRGTTKETKPLGIGHPQASLAQITSVSILEVNSSMPHNIDGWIVTMTLMEYREPAPAKSSKNIDKNKGKTLSETGLPKLPQVVR